MQAVSTSLRPSPALGGRLLARTAIARRHASRQGDRPRAQEGSEAEPDWEAELAIFKQRTLKPSQLEVQRKIAEEKVDVGRVSNHAGSWLPAAAAAAASAACPAWSKALGHGLSCALACIRAGPVLRGQCGHH
jgi:hypothetical protein